MLAETYQIFLLLLYTTNNSEGLHKGSLCPSLYSPVF